MHRHGELTEVRGGINLSVSQKRCCFEFALLLPMETSGASFRQSESCEQRPEYGWQSRK